MDTYLDLARQGKNDWWRFLLAVLLTLFVWQIIGSVPYAFLIIWTLIGNPQADVTPAGLTGVDPLVVFVALMLGAACLMIGLFVAVRFVHQRRFLTLVTPARSIDWMRVFQGFGIWFVLAALMSVLEALLHPGRYIWTPDLKHFIPFVGLALVFIPIQTSAEELFFRGYILQSFGLRLRNIWVLSVISGLLFGLPHLLNPEASVNYALMGLFYFSMGAFLAYITLRDGSLELALGIHAANNLFSALFANYTTTVLPSPSLFTVKVLDAVYSVPAALVGMVIFVLVFSTLLRRRSPARDSAAQ